MYILKGFYEFPSLYNNNLDEIAKLGELSDNSRSYARDKTTHMMSEYRHLNFISFYSIRDDNVSSVNTIYRKLVLSLGNFIYERAHDQTINSNVTSFRNLIQQEFGTVLNSFTCGKMVFNDTVWMPEWIQFKSSESNEDNLIRIWLSDESFSGQYDEYLINIIHPIVPYDDFFKDPLWVRDKLKDYDLTAKIEEAQEVRREYPYTYLKVFDAEYTPPNYPQLNYKAYWLVQIYGEAGNNTDIIKEIITGEILANSNHSRDEWEEILPDLFKNTELIFVPNFIKYAVDSSDLRAGIYSPTVSPNKLLPLMHKTVKGYGYSETHITANYEISSNTLKSIVFGVIGSTSNRENKFTFTQLIPDYFLTTNDSLDINRVHPDTIEFMNKFAGLIKAAEDLTAYSSVPQGYSRAIRDDIVYASFYFKHVNYLMVSKSSIEEKSV